VLGLALAAAALSGCTGGGGTPQITDVPSTTTHTLTVLALSQDPDATLLARAEVVALRAKGLSAQLAPAADGATPKKALAALRSGDADILVGGATRLAALAPSDEKGSASGATAGASPSQGSSSALPPQDAAAALSQAQAALPSGTAVAAEALKDRRTVLLTTRALSTRQGVQTVAQAAARCHDSTVAVPSSWRSAWYATWTASAGCTPKERDDTDGEEATLSAVLDGDAEYGIASSTDPRVQDWGLVALQERSQGLGADPLVSVVRKKTVGKDALSVMGSVASAAQGDDWDQLRRLTDGEKDTALVSDVGRWLVLRKVLGGDDSGMPTTATPSS